MIDNKRFYVENILHGVLEGKVNGILIHKLYSKLEEFLLIY